MKPTSSIVSPRVEVRYSPVAKARGPVVGQGQVVDRDVVVGRLPPPRQLPPWSWRLEGHRDAGVVE